MSYLILAKPQLGSYTCRSCLRRLTKAAPGRWHSTGPRAGPVKKSRAELPSNPARTRFAPSPTGYLHLGSLRTALFNYLLAQRTGGQFLLRIEDTDQKRTVPDAEARLLRDLRWAGLQWDEGLEVGGPYGPYKQSERTELYQAHASALLSTGHAYRCFCSSERLNALAEHRYKLGLATDYDRTCAHLPAAESEDRAAQGEKFVVRLLAPDQYPKYQDLIYGAFKPLKRPRGDESYEDPILLKSDGLPTYHLANVVDDHHMKITHVIRGSEWMPSTPKHIAMYNAFGWSPPHFAHVGLLVDEHGNKLSKRNFDTDITAFKDMDIFPETLTNFSALLGWSHSEKSDVMNLQKLVEKFTLKFTKGNTVVTFGKLHFLQKKHASERAKIGGQGLQDMVQSVLRLLKSSDSPYKGYEQYAGPKPEKYVERILLADPESYANANEFTYKHAYMFTPVKAPTNSATDGDEIPERCKSLVDVSATNWTAETLKEKVAGIIDARPEGRKGGKDVYHYLRMALTGREHGMRSYDIMVILGREESLKRLAAV